MTKSGTKKNNVLILILAALLFVSWMPHSQAAWWPANKANKSKKETPSTHSQKAKPNASSEEEENVRVEVRSSSFDTETGAREASEEEKELLRTLEGTKLREVRPVVKLSPPPVQRVVMPLPRITPVPVQRYSYNQAADQALRNARELTRIQSLQRDLNSAKSARAGQQT